MRPVFQPFITPPASGIIYVVDSSGMNDDVRRLTCNAWGTMVATDNGLTVTPRGSFDQRSCNEMRAVACCALIPVPEAPTLLMDAAGAAGFAALAMSKRAKVRNQAFGLAAAVVAVSAGFAFARRRGRATHNSTLVG